MGRNATILLQIGRHTPRWGRNSHDAPRDSSNRRQPVSRGSPIAQHDHSNLVRAMSLFPTFWERKQHIVCFMCIYRVAHLGHYAQ